MVAMVKSNQRRKRQIGIVIWSLTLMVLLAGAIEVEWLGSSRPQASCLSTFRSGRPSVVNVAGLHGALTNPDGLEVYGEHTLLLKTFEYLGHGQAYAASYVLTEAAR